MKTENMAIHLTSDGHLFDVAKGIPADVALSFAADLGEGIQLLTERMYDDVNEDNDAIYTCELRALGFLAEVSGALARSVSRSMRMEKGDDR